MLQVLVLGCTGRVAQRFAFDASICIFGDLHFDHQVLLQGLVDVNFHQNILSVLRIGLVLRAGPVVVHGWVPTTRDCQRQTNPDLQQDSYRLSRLPKPKLSRILLSIDFRCTLTDVCQFGQCQQLHAALSLRLPSPAGRNQDWNVMNLIWKYMERVQRGFTNQDMPRHW